MKNEVNRTFTVKKNKFTNFLSCFYANTPQNTGGGNSHSSTVVTPVWKGSKPTVSRRSTDSQSQDHRNHTPISKALKYAAMLLLTLTLGIGNAWANQTDLISGVTLPDKPTTSLDMASQTTFTADANGWIVFDPYAAAANQSTVPTWWKHSSKGTQSQEVTSAILEELNPRAPFVAGSSSWFKVTSSYTGAIRFTGATDASFLVNPRGSRKVIVALYSYNTLSEEWEAASTEESPSTSGYAVLDFTSLTASTTYIAYIYANSTSNCCISQIALKKYVNTTGPYAITYNKNNEGASGTMTDSNSPYAKNSTVTVLSNSFTAPTGKVFVEWNTKADGSGLAYDPGDIFSATEDVRLYAQWAYPATGTGTITYTLTRQSAAVSGAVSGVSTISGFSTSIAQNNLTINTSGNGKDNYAGRCQVPAGTSFNSSNYYDLQFEVASGYKFTPSSVSVMVNPFTDTGDMKVKVELKDEQTTPVSVMSNQLACAKSTDNEIVFADDAFDDVELKGTVHIRIYMYGPSNAKTCYIKSPITVAGTVASEGGGDETGDTPANYDVTHALTNNVVATSGATGASAATEGVDYDAVFAPSKLGYSLPSTISVTIGGNAATSGTDYTWNSSTGAFQVPAGKVTGNIVVTIAGVAPVKTFKSTYTDFTQVGETNTYYTYLTQTNYTSYAVAGWMQYDVPKTGEQKLLIDPATDAATTPASKSTYGIVKQVETRYMEFYLTGVTSVKFYFHNSNSSNDRTIKYKLNDGDGTDLVTVNRSTSNSASIALSSSTENTIRIYADEELYVCAMKVTLPDASCGATAPGDIEKGEASGGTGKITLKVEDDGEPVTGDAWYWQSAASGEAKTDEYDAENGKEVNAASTYYLRSYNTAGDCWSATKSVEVTAADLLTAISPTLSYATSNIVVGNSSSPTLEGNTGSGSVSYALNNVSPAGSLTINSETGVVTAVTAGGTATVTATIAANGGYAGNTATSGTIKAVANPLGTHTLTWVINVSTSSETDVDGGTTDIGTGDKDPSSSYISNMTDLTGVGVKRTTTGKNSNTGKIETPASYDKDKYVSFTFDVANGYQFTPSAVSIKTVAVSTEKDLKFEFSDANGSYSVTKTNLSKDATAVTNELDFSECNVDFTGTVTVKIYVYGAENMYRLSTPLTITGTIAAEVTKYDLTFAAGTGASGSMSTLKYAASTEVTLPACTFTAPSGKEFDAWVVTKTVGGAAVTVTNGKFTMPAEAVTATATWKDRPKHTDATLSDLTVAGETVDDFDAATTSYNVELPFGTTSAPTVAATATDAEYVKSVVVTQASSASGDATVVVTAEDGTTTKTYTIHFSVEASKDIELVWATDKQRCDATTPSAKALIATASTYLSASYTGSAAEGGSLNTGKTTGSKIIITAQPGYAFKAMGFYGKIEDGTCNFYNDGVVETIGTSTGDACYSDVFSNDEVHEFVFELTGTNGIYIRNMQLTMIQACTPKTIAWTAEPAAEYELGSSPADIAASANNGTVSYASTDGDVIAVNESTGALTLKALGTVTLSASVPAGDGVTYCDEGAQVSKANVKTYYLVTFDKQNETTPATVKYYKNDAAIALPEDPTYSGFNFLGWFDASTGGNAVTSAITPTASRTVYAQWEAQCAGPTITAQPASANYFVGRTPTALSCEATPGVDGKALTYTWYSCDDVERTNPVALAGAPTPSTAAVGTFYYYCTVTEADCDVVRNSNVATITVAEKDKVCLVKADLQAGDKNASISAKTGSYKDDANIAINIAKNLKLGETGNYVKLGVTGTSFANGDEVVITLVDGSTLPAWLQLFAGTGSDLLAERKSGVTAGANTLTISNVPANQKVLYLYRTSASGTNMNPFVQSMAVYRACPAPILEGISFNSTDAEADELEENTFNVELTNGTNLASMEVVHNVMWVGAHATTPYTIMTNEGAWAWGENTYRVMDKDGDYTDYTINLTEALPDAEEPVIATDLTDHAYCAGEIPELDATANEVSDGGTLTYQWYDANGAIEGATNAKYTPEGEGSYYCKVTNTLAEHRPMTMTSATAVLTQKAATSISGDTEFEIEQGATVKFQPTIAGANATYAWYACDAEGNHEGDALGTKASYTTAALNDLGTFYYVLEVTAECGNASQIFTVNVAAVGVDLVAHTPGHYYGQTLKVYNGRSYEIYGMSRISSKNYLWAGTPISASTDENCVLAFNNSGETTWLTNSVHGQNDSYTSISNAKQFTSDDCSGYTMHYRAAHSLVLKVKGYDQFSIYSKDNSGSTKYMEVLIDGVVVKSTAKNSFDVYDFDLTEGEHVIVMRGNAESSGSNNELSQFSLRLPVVAQVDETEYLFVQDAIDAASDPITITMLGNSYEDIVIANGKDVTIAGSGHTINNLTVETGGKVNASSALTLVENLYLEAQAGASGQVLGATNVTANAVYMDVTFFKGDNATTLDAETANRWYMISAPFDVNLNGGFSLTDGTPMVFGQTDGENIFDLFEYDGNKRASTGVTGWKRVQGKMKAGRACLIGFNPGQPTTIRLKAASTVLSEPTSITLNAYDGDDANRNWNGVANPTMHYTDLSKDVQTYNNEDGENGRKYIAYSASSTSFVVGTAFFVQETGTIDLSAASHSEFRAPQRQANERYEACVRIFRQEATDFADQMYVRASENASSEYEQGHDMITWNGTTANTALIWAENYGKRLAIEEAPLVNDKATYNLGIFAPIAGEYRIEVANPSEDATLYLTKNGRIYWNLTMGACELDLNQGQNNEYGLVLRAEAPAVTTGMDEIHSEAGVQKIIIDENVFILRGEQLFDMTGKLVK